MGALRIVGVLLAGLIAAPVLGTDAVDVSNGWARATLPGQKVAGAYFEIRSTVDARLVGVSVSGARSAELHSMKLENGTMRMRALEGVELPAGKVVKLEPNGLHVMLFGLERPLQAGQKLSIKLTVAPAGQPAHEVQSTLEVRESEASAGHKHH